MAAGGFSSFTSPGSMLNHLSAQKKRLIVIGGGAAGFFCAINAARLNPQLEVIILEKSNKVLSKVSVSGGGRCNVTHACFDIADMVKKYPRGGHFVKKAFHRFFTTDTIQWFAQRQVALKTEADGRMFPASNTSQTIVDCLWTEAARHKVEVILQAEVKKVDSRQPETARPTWLEQDPEKNNAGKEKGFVLTVVVRTGKEATFPAPDARLMTTDYLCVACGGYPKASMFEWLLQTGHSIETPVPSLFTFNMPGNPMTELMGISVEHVKVKIAGTKLETAGPLLITHWGLSGPAILKMSAWGARAFAEKNYAFTAFVNWLPAYHQQSLAARLDELRFEMAGVKMANKNPFGLPARLWEFFLQQSGIRIETRWADLPSQLQHKLEKLLCLYECTVKGKTTFKEEFVTAGGIRLNEVDANTMMSRKWPGLFFAGEILDVDGVTGGFNFQHAWTSGWIAAQSIAAVSAE